jgi:hypothetical protein
LSRKNKNNPVGSILLMLAGALLILGAIGWYLVAIAGQPADVQNVADEQDNFPQIERIGVQEAKTAYDQNRAVFLDVRTNEEYIQGHIPGAINIPTLDLPGRLAELNPDDWIVTY